MAASIPYPNPEFPKDRELRQSTTPRLLFRRAKALLKNRSLGKNDVMIERVSGRGDVPPKRSVILIGVLRNAMHDLPQFLNYYRGLGVERFAIVDDASTDGSREFLQQQADVDLYRSNRNYQEAVRGRVWRDLLIARYGVNRWYVSVDSDEYLVFPDCETLAIPDFARRMFRGGIRHVHAPMIDIYPEKEISSEPLLSDPTGLPTDLCPLFDTDSYWMKSDARGLSIRGGPRYRVFGQTIRMTKFPLMFVDSRTCFTTQSSHASWPFSRNYTYPRGVLLHNKFAPGYRNRFDKFIQEGSHADGAVYYSGIVNHDNFSANVAFEYEGSAIYENSGQLCRLGFFLDT